MLYFQSILYIRKRFSSKLNSNNNSIILIIMENDRIFELTADIGLHYYQPFFDATVQMVQRTKSLAMS